MNARSEDLNELLIKALVTQLKESTVLLSTVRLTLKDVTARRKATYAVEAANALIAKATQATARAGLESAR